MVEYACDPMTTFFIPIFDSFKEDNHFATALLIRLFSCGNMFRAVLPETSKDIDFVMRNN